LKWNILPLNRCRSAAAELQV